MQSAIRFSSLNLRSRKWHFNGVSKRCFFIDDLNRKDERIEVSQYWGLVSKGKLPWNSYEARDNKDGSVDLKAHHKPEVFVDKLAFLIVKLLRIPTDLFFKKHYGCRAVMLETIAGVPGMVAGMLLHLRSLRRIEHTGGWIKALLEEAENERMHLMTFMEIYQPKWHERAIVVSVQFIAFTGYLIVYSAYPRLAHRVVAYLEEEAIHSYTDYLEELDSGRMPNIPAPPIAIDYWNLSKDATLRDVVVAVRADEAHHRDVNHFAADIHKEKKKLKEAPIRG